LRGCHPLAYRNEVIVNPQLIVFDFDGTLAHSASVKTDAFHLLYLDEFGQDVADRVLAHHLEHQGVSRYDKIRYFEEEIIGRECTPARLEEAAARFSGLVEAQVIAAPPIAGAEEFLTAGRAAHFTVASATPTVELRRIVTGRGWDEYFVSVDGTPDPKAANIEKHMAMTGIPTSRTLMVGDQMSDHSAAQKAGVAFVAVQTDRSVAFPAGTVVIPDLFGLPDLLS
jgi:phosphoglycolate phosphatase-like HAD superfamily hydrolase